MLELLASTGPINVEMQLYGSVMSAVVGALLAFSLVLVRDRFSRIHQRKVAHYTTLVKLNRMLSLQADRLVDNIFTLPKASETLRCGHVYFTVIHPVEFTTDILTDLHNLRLEGALYSYFDALQKDNDDINNLQVAMDSLKNALLGGSIDNETYERNALTLAEALDQLHDRLEKVSLKINAHATAAINDLIDRDEGLGMKIDRWVIGQRRFNTEELETASEVIYRKRRDIINRRNEDYEKQKANSRKKT